MEKYVQPELEIIAFEAENVICSSSICYNEGQINDCPEDCPEEEYCEECVETPELGL